MTKMSKRGDNWYHVTTGKVKTGTARVRARFGLKTVKTGTVKNGTIKTGTVRVRVTVRVGVRVRVRVTVRAKILTVPVLTDPDLTCSHDNNNEC